MVKNFVFGYGSLINKESRDKSGISGECFLVRVKGFKNNFYDNVVFWVYVFDFESLNNNFYANLSYVDVILQGCLNISYDFALEFMNTTSNWPKIFNDRNNPIYPRALDYNNVNVDKIDFLLKKFVF